MKSSARSFCLSRNTRSVVKVLKVTSSMGPTSEYGLVQSSPVPKIRWFEFLVQSIADPEALGDEDLGALSSSFYTKIAGVTHRNEDRKSRQRLITQCRIGEELTLQREPDNPVDPRAIKVLRVTGEQLGY